MQDRCFKAMRAANVAPFQDGRIRWEMPQTTFEALKAELVVAGVPVVSRPGESPTHETRLFGFPISLQRRFRLIVDDR